MRTKWIVAVSCLLVLALALVTLSCTPVRAQQLDGQKRTAAPNGPVTPGPSDSPDAPRKIREGRLATPSAKILPPSPQAPTATPDLDAWLFSTPVCTASPANLTLSVTEKLGQVRSPLEKRLAESGGAPARWLPDGKAIVYSDIVRGQPTMLYQVQVETGARTAISATTDPFGGDHLQVLPDGRVIFLEKDKLQAWDSKTGMLNPLQAIGCIDSKTQTPVASYYTAVSPDGARVAEACAGSLYLTDVSASKTITLSDQVGIFVRPMAWSPDGRQLAYSVQPDASRIAELWLVNGDGSNARRLWQDEGARAFDWLTWMPDGQTLLFIKNPGGTSFGPAYAYVGISVSGGAPKELFKNGQSLQLFDNGRKMLISRSVEDSGDWIVELAQ